jgi:hypothetical protein
VNRIVRKVRPIQSNEYTINRESYYKPVYEALSNEHLDELIDDIRQHCPMETDFEKAKRPTILSLQLQTMSFGVTRREFHPAPEEDITRCVEEDYPRWLERCREHLGQAHKLLGMAEYNMSLKIELANKGTRPALDLQIAFRTHGDIGILPNREGEASESMGSVALPFSLPKAPAAPQGEWKTYNPLDHFGSLHNRGFDPLGSKIPCRSLHVPLTKTVRAMCSHGSILSDNVWGYRVSSQ